MDTPNQKQGRKMMEKNIVKMNMTDDGYRQIAEMTIINVLDNVKSTRNWSKRDASLLIMGAMMIVRHLTDDEFYVLTLDIENRYTDK